jgi:pimeloyl-ACP methyl ester carboxylesterase
MPPDPFKSVVPLEMFDAIADWLGDHFPAAAPRSVDYSAAPTSGRPTVTPMALPTAATREQVADIGGLFGILTEPLVPSLQTGTAVVLLNIGANYHIGSNRMYVRMARAWAEQGLQVLRMDFSGMGDSPVTGAGKENEVYAARFMAEARSAIDFMAAQGATRFVLIGLCSGAYVAYHTAIGDPRVSGIVMINPMTFHWNENDSLEIRIRQSFKTTTQYKRSLFAPRTWLRIAKGEVVVAAIAGELARRSQRRVVREVKSLLAKATGDIAEATGVERGFRQLCARGTQSLLIFGAEDGGIDLVEEHLGRDARAMRHLSSFRMEILEGPDHTFTPLESQERLLKLTSAYLIAHAGDHSR